MSFDPELELLQVASELEPMLALYRERKPKRVLEIGSWDGGTLHRWLTEGTPELVVAVDLVHRHPENYEDWRNEDTHLEVISGDSCDRKVKERIAGLGPFDWIFVDGDHTGAGVNNDALLAESLISPGGVVLFHDIQPESGVPSYPPGLMVDEYERQGRKVERWIDGVPALWAHGIGVVYF